MKKGSDGSSVENDPAGTQGQTGIRYYAAPKRPQSGLCRYVSCGLTGKNLKTRQGNRFFHYFNWGSNLRLTFDIF
jgi:hypothetical protein